MKVLRSGKLITSVTQGGAGAYAETTVPTNLSVLTEPKNARALLISGIRYTWYFSTHVTGNGNFNACVARESPGTALSVTTHKDLDTISQVSFAVEMTTSGMTSVMPYYHDLREYPEMVSAEELYVAVDGDSGVATVVIEIVYKLVQPTQQELLQILQRY